MMPFCNSTRKSAKYFPATWEARNRLGFHAPCCESIARRSRGCRSAPRTPLLAVHLENQVKGVLAESQAPQEATRGAIVLFLDLDGELVGCPDRAGLVLISHSVARRISGGRVPRPSPAAVASTFPAHDNRQTQTAAPQETIDRPVQPRLTFLQRQPHGADRAVQFAIELVGNSTSLQSSPSPISSN